MATIRSQMSLNDGMSGVLKKITSALDLTLASFEQVQRASGNAMDVAEIETARGALVGASNAVDEMAENYRRAAQGADRLNERINRGARAAAGMPEAEIPISWKSDDLPVFTSSGLERFQQELQSANGMLKQLENTQADISRQAQVLEFLPPEAAVDIQAVQTRIQGLQSAISQMDQNPLDVDGSAASAQLERLRAHLSQTITAQEELNAAMKGADVGNMNSAFLQLSQDLGQIERSVRDSFARPVEVPISWKSDDLPVFTGTGLDRFQQELRSANGMMDQLAAAQAGITQQAQALDFLPPGAMTDIENLQNRVKGLQEAIAQVEENPLGMDSSVASSQMERLRAQLSQTVAVQEELNAAMNGMDVGDVNGAYLRLSQNVAQIERSVRDSFAQPVEIPIKWNVPNTEVFTGTGMERYQQEVQSAQHMLGNLHRVQQQINQQAANINIFPPDALSDLNAVQGRIQAIQNRIQQITNNPINKGFGAANAELEQLRGQLSHALGAQQALNSAVAGMDVEGANAAYVRLSQCIGGTERYIRDNVDAQGRFNREIQEGTGCANHLMNAIKGAVTAYGGLQGLKKMVGLSDELTSTTARLSLIADNTEALGAIDAVTNAAAGVQDVGTTISVENTGALSAIDAVTDASAEVEDVGAAISMDNTDALGAIDAVTNAAAGVQDVGATVSVENAEALSAIDAVTNAVAGVQNVGAAVTVDDGGSVALLEQKIRASAHRSRASYLDTANAIASMGANAGNAFSGNDELIAFMEQVNKQFVIGGASAQGQSAAMLQLTQAMAAGALRGEELNSILENAPGIARAIEQYMGVAEGSIKQYAEQGLITSEVVKNALFAVADETNEKVASMPYTFSQVWRIFSDDAITALDPLLTKINELANSVQIQEMFDGLLNSLSLVADMATPALDLVANGFTIFFEAINQLVEGAYNVYAVFSTWEYFPNLLSGIQSAVFFVMNAMQSLSTLASNVANFIISNWSWIEPIIMGVATAILLYKTYTMLAAGAQAAWNAITGASPIFRIVAGVIALITAITAVVRATNTFGSQSVSVLGTICGMVNVVIQFFVNLGLAVADIALGIWNALGACCENIGTAFYNTIAKVQGWFYGLLSTALTVVEGICAALNKLPFVEFDYSGIAAKADEYAAKSAEAYGRVEDYTSISDAFNKGFNTFDAFSKGWAQDAFDSGAAFGDGILDKFGNKLDDLFNDKSLQSNFPPDDSFGNSLDGICDNTGDIADNTGGMASALEVSGEELKYLRDIAERDAINRFTTAEVKIDMTGMTNKIDSNMDLDGVIRELTGGFSEALVTAAEGVHT